MKIIMHRIIKIEYYGYLLFLKFQLKHKVYDNSHKFLIKVTQLGILMEHGVQYWILPFNVLSSSSPWHFSLDFKCDVHACVYLFGCLPHLWILIEIRLVALRDRLQIIAYLAFLYWFISTSLLAWFANPQCRP